MSAIGLWFFSLWGLGNTFLILPQWTRLPKAGVDYLYKGRREMVLIFALRWGLRNLSWPQNFLQKVSSIQMPLREISLNFGALETILRLRIWEITLFFSSLIINLKLTEF